MPRRAAGRPPTSRGEAPSAGPGASAASKRSRSEGAAPVSSSPAGSDETRDGIEMRSPWLAGCEPGGAGALGSREAWVSLRRGQRLRRATIKVVITTRIDAARRRASSPSAGRSRSRPRRPRPSGPAPPRGATSVLTTHAGRGRGVGLLGAGASGAAAASSPRTSDGAPRARPRRRREDRHARVPATTRVRRRFVAGRMAGRTAKTRRTWSLE